MWSIQGAGPRPLLVDQDLDTWTTGIPTQTVLSPVSESVWASVGLYGYAHMCTFRYTPKESCWQGGLDGAWLQGPECHHDYAGCETEPSMGKEEGWDVSYTLVWKSKGSKSFQFKIGIVP